MKYNADNEKRPRESVGRWISVLHRYGKIYFDRELAQKNIGSGQLSFLMVLSREDGINQEALTKNINVDKATTTRAVNKLIKEGYVKREIDQDDKRAYKIYLTQKGKKIIPILKDISSKWTGILLSGFSKKEEAQLFQMLERLAQNATGYQ